jgi:transcriptional regulator
MYQPEHFKLEDLASLHQVMRAYPLAQLITAGPGGLMANPVPFMLHAADGERGVLHAHLARPNPQWREIEAGADALVVFQGPEGYVTPAWYASKREHGKVVPTWNYVVVQARGQARAIHDNEWLVRHVAELSDRHEAPRAAPWSVDDAPKGYVPALARGIVGVEIAIASLAGKFKMSQNRPDADREGVAEGFVRESGAAGADVSLLVRRLSGARP